MSRGTTRPKRAPKSERPSLFFMLALAVGVILLMTMFIRMVSKPNKPPMEPKRGAVEQRFTPQGSRALT